MMLLLALALLTAPARAAEQPSHSVEIRGTAAMAGLARVIAERFMREHPGTLVTVETCAAEQALKSVIVGTADLAMGTDELPEAITALMAAKQVELEKTDVYRDAIAVVAHPKHSVRSVSMKQLRDLFRGAITNWSALGGPSQAVTVLSPAATSTAYEVFKLRVLGDSAVLTPKAITVEAEDLGETLKPGVISYVTLALVARLGLEVVAIDGVVPTHDTIKSARYPIVRHMSIYQRRTANELTGEVAKYFVAPDIGQKLVLDAGNTPVK